MSRLQLLARIAAVTAANVLAGRLALYLAVPPGYVSSLWPPAGISLAAVLLYGSKMWPGVFLGSLLVQIPILMTAWVGGPPARLLGVSVVIALGATLQALGAAWALRKLGVKPLELDEGHDVFQFMLVGGLGFGLVSSLLGAWALYFGEAIQSGQMVRVWSTWWLGEALGAMLFGPVVIGLSGQARNHWKGRRYQVFASLGAMFVVTVAVFGLACYAESGAIAARFQTQAFGLAHRLEAAWRGYEAIVSSTASLFETAGTLDKSQFELFAGRLLSENLGIVALQWAPRVDASQVEEFTARARSAGVRDFAIRELAPPGRIVPARPRDVYYPVLYQQPSTGFERVVGFDVASESFRRETLDRARVTGKVVASVLLRPVRSPDAQDGLALVRAVFDAPASPLDRAVKGYVLGVFRVPRMVGAALARESWHGFRLMIIDELSDQPIVYQDVTDLQQFSVSEATEAGLAYETLQTFGGRRWRLVFSATRQYVREESGWQPYGVLTAGLAFCVFVSGFLLVLTGRTSRIEQLVDERTEELRTINANLAHEVDVRHKVEAELRLARDEALEASRCKSDFLANMSHEIRTPVNAIIGLADLLSESPVDGEQRRLPVLIRTAGNDLLQLINDILDYSKIEAGRQDVLAKPFDLSASIRSIVDLMAPRATKKGLRLELDYAQPLEDLAVGDEGIFRQVLLNLVSNAVKFTEEGHVTLRVHHEPVGPGLRRFVFHVIDTGIGISEEAQPMLFEKFFQADVSTTRKYAGTGLGLAISKQLVHLMGGGIGFKSILGAGSDFYFEITMPVQPRGAEKARPGELAHATGSPGPGQNSLRLLAVDDNLANQLVISKMLERLGFRVDVVANGLEALEQVGKERYGAILMDCNMPLMDGYEATRAIRARQAVNGGCPPDVRIIGVTAYAMHGDREKCLAAGMDDYVAKPLTLERLKQVVERWVAGAAAPEPVPESGPREEELAGIRGHVRSLISSTGRDTAQRVIDLFLADLKPRLARIEQARIDNDAVRLTTETHALAGGFANLGARQASRSCLELEELARAKRMAEVGPLLETLRPQIEGLGQFLENVLSELG